MASNTRVVVLFLFLLAGAEAERIHAFASIAATSRARINAQTTDLDWAGCGAKVGLLSGPSCSMIDGCEIKKVWLDTPRQSCRFSDKHKLMPENVPKFLPVELARLEEKSATFAKKGCLFGDWLSKCYRRMSQIIRLLTYVRRAVTDAKKGGSHPAKALATSPETSEKIGRVADNLAEGFRKYEAKVLTGKEKVDFAGGFTMLSAAPDILRAVAAATEGAENRSLTEEEKGTMENVGAVEAMLKVVGTSLDDEQRAELYAQMEGGSFSEEGSEDKLDTEVEDLASSLDEAIQVADTEERIDLEGREKDVDDVDDPEDVVAQAADAAALVQISGQSGSNSTGAVQTRRTGPLKWLFQNGLGWFVTRVAWLLLFLVGTAVGLIRAAVIFPLLFISCTLSKFLMWIFRDVGYNFLWEGKTDIVAQRFMNIGKCAPWMWDAVGFNSSAKDGGKQVFLEPAVFASSVTGVQHLYKNAKDPCKKLVCGTHTSCKNGHCICDLGFYPDANFTGHCSEAPTESGCRCKAGWTESELIVFTKQHYGCPPAGKCQVDQHDPSFTTCKNSLQSGQSGVGHMLGFKGTEPRDKCTPMRFRAVVQPLISTAAQAIA